MTEQKKVRRPIRTLLVTAAAVAALAVSAGAVNVATDGAIAHWMASVMAVNEFKSVATMEDGRELILYSAPAAVENRDGRAILVVGEDEVDITDALNTDGAYHYERTDGGTVCRVEVTGTPEQWSLTVETFDEGGEPGVVISYGSDAAGAAITSAALDDPEGEDAQKIGVEHDGAFEIRDNGDGTFRTITRGAEEEAGQTANFRTEE